MNNKYEKAYTEVLEIISHFSNEEYSKIPEEKINFYKQNQDKNYKYSIDPEKDLSKQYISEEANAILVSLFRDYFATERQKEVLKNLLNQNQAKLEEKKREKYSTDVFKKEEIQKREEDIKKKEEYLQDNQLIQYKQTFFSKFIEFIKKIINRNKDI